MKEYRCYTDRRADAPLALAPAMYVVVEDGVMRPLRHVVYHSPDGLAHGYPGSGPADLALSMLADLLGERDLLAEPGRLPARVVVRTRAWVLHQPFKERFITPLDPARGWRISAPALTAWVVTQTPLLPL